MEYQQKMKAALLCLFLFSPLVCWPQSAPGTPPRLIAKLSNSPQRRKALDEALKRYSLSDPDLQAGIVDLFNRETNDPNWDELEESQWYEEYYDEISGLCQKVAFKYSNQQAWHALFFSNFNEDSKFGLWLAAQPSVFPSFLAMAHDPRPFYATRGLTLAGEAMASCERTQSKGCNAVLAQKQPLFALMRERIQLHADINSNDEATMVLGAIQAYKACGSEADISFLREQIELISERKPEAGLPAETQQATISLIRQAIQAIEARSSKSAKP